MIEETDYLVIGGGPAGYVSAIRGAQLGAKVTLVEKGEIGGVCLNRGCIPTKSLLSVAELYHKLGNLSSFGLRAEGINLDWKGILERKDQVVRRLVGGVKHLLRAHKVRIIEGEARFLEPQMIEVKGKGRFKAKEVLVATGSCPTQLPIKGMEGPGILNSDSALTLEGLPHSLLIIGGGGIGVEFAFIYGFFGCKVTLVELMDHILPAEDEELCLQLERTLRREGTKVYIGSQVKEVSFKNGSYSASLETPTGEVQVTIEKILLAPGRKPYFKGLGLEEIGVKVENGAIAVNELLQTNIPHIYAAGDVIGGYLLAYVASMEGEIAAENALGGNLKVNYRAVPRCVFSWPELASVGLTAKGATELGYEVSIGRFPFAANGRALSEGEVEGWVKVVMEKRTKEILGIHILGPRATDLIAEAALALQMGAKGSDLVRTFHPHPTLSEPLREASLAALGRPLHIL